MAEWLGLKVDRKVNKQEEKPLESFVPPKNEDGALVVDSANQSGFSAQYLQLDDFSTLKDAERIQKYRRLSVNADVSDAIFDITNEAIVVDTEKDFPVSLDLSALEKSETINNKIIESFVHVLKLLEFNRRGQDIFKQWYVDGRIAYHKMIDEKQPKKGIQELRWIDPVHLR